MAEIVTVVTVAGGRQQIEVTPAALLGEIHDPRDRRLGDDHEIETLRNMRRTTVEPVEEVRAAGTGPLTLRPEHEAVDRERVLVAEQLGELAPLPASRFEQIVLRDLAAMRQSAPLGRDPFDLAAQLHLRGQEGISRLAIGGRLVGEMQMVKFVGYAD
jgi:hypothetical protein